MHRLEHAYGVTIKAGTSHWPCRPETTCNHGHVNYQGRAEVVINEGRAQVTLIAEALHQRVLGHRAHGVDRGALEACVPLQRRSNDDERRLRPWAHRSSNDTSISSWFNKERWLMVQQRAMARGSNDDQSSECSDVQDVWGGRG